MTSRFAFYLVAFFISAACVPLFAHSGNRLFTPFQEFVIMVLFASPFVTSAFLLWATRRKVKKGQVAPVLAVIGILFSLLFISLLLVMLVFDTGFFREPVLLFGGVVLFLLAAFLLHAALSLFRIYRPGGKSDGKS